ncbi:MAG: hypothetical protein D3910_21895 [Candidatus Electrothrix sp. ATG2]|nr:hypothetical protein [Candidatus Electrothrix sp. ATG2]
MSVELIQGGTGDGKSHAAMLRVFNHLLEGGVVGLNFRLTEDWAYIFASVHPHVLDGSSSIAQVAESAYKRCFYIGEVSTLESLCKHYNDRCIGPVAKRFERRILVVLDEAQLYLNAREWRKNAPWVQLFTQHRKMGLDLILLAHHIRFIDAQARELIAMISRVMNLQESFRVPLLDIRFPHPFFIYITKPRLSERGGSWRLLRFSQAVGEMYDSHEIFAFDSLAGEIEAQGVFNDQLSVYGAPMHEAELPVQPDPLLSGTWWCSFDPGYSGRTAKYQGMALCF